MPDITVFTFFRWVRSFLILMLLMAAFCTSVPFQPAYATTGSVQMENFSWISAAWDDDAILLRFGRLNPGTYELYELTAPPRIVLDIPGLTCDEENPVSEAFDFTSIGILNQLRASCGPDGVRVVLESSYPLYWEITSPENRQGLDILCYIRFRQTVEEIQLDPGTTYLARRYVTPSGQRFTHAVISDSGYSRLRPMVLMAGDVTSRNLASVTDFVTGSGAAAGINGGYFQWPGISLSLVIQEGIIKSPPVLHRPAFMVLQNGAYAMDYPPVKGYAVSASGLRWDFDVINQAPGPGQIALLTPGHPSRIRDDAEGWILLIKDERVDMFASFDDEIEDLSDRYIIWSRSPSPGFNMLTQGEEIDVNLYIDNGTIDIMQAIQGGPFLVRDGRVDITTEENDIGRDIAYGRSARTAVGFDNFGKLFLVNVEGPASGRSTGATLQELAWTMSDLGATWAMNLDGGSSTGMAISYHATQSGFPSGGRSVATALVLFDESGYFQGQRFFF